MSKYFITSKSLKKWRPCESGVDKFNENVGRKIKKNDNIGLDEVLEINGLTDAIWCLRAVEHPDIERDARLFACACAKSVLKYYEKQYPDEKRVRDCINTAIRYAKGKATKEELDAAWAAADAAARDAAWAAAWAAAAWAAADAARDAAWAAAAAAARAAEEKKQIKFFKKYILGE